MEIKANGKEYALRFSFDAAEDRTIVQKTFNYLTGSSMFEDMDGNPVQRALEGAAITVGNMPQTCIDAVYAGCLEKNAVTREEAKQIARAYLSENKKNYRDLFLEIIKAMEEDGFFDLSGITSSLNAMAENIEKQMAEENPEK